MCLNLYTLMENLSVEEAYRVQKILLSEGIYSMIIPGAYQKTEGLGNGAALYILKEDLNRVYPVLSREFYKAEVVLNTERFILRELVSEDAPNLCNLFSSVQNNADFYKKREMDQVLDLIKVNIENCREHGYGLYALVLNSGNLLSGCVGFVNRRDSYCSDEIEFVCCFERELWENGYALKASELCLGYGMGRLGFQRVISLVDAQNERKEKIITSIGMKHEKKITIMNKTLDLYAV